MVKIESLPSSSSASSSSSSISRWEYDVFLSFSGKDTRNNFTDFLYEALDQRGIKTFRDDKRLETGEEFAPELLKAIGESWCSIIVFSQSYASSSWCLKELAEIVKQQERGYKVYPIFYDIEVSDLRRQKGKVEDAFAKHEQRYGEDEVKEWRAALKKVADIHGWTTKDRSESKLVKDIVNRLLVKLQKTYTIAHKDLVGIDSRLAELNSKLNIGGDDVRIVGIFGMGGIGKTTLARLVYDRTSPQDFEGESFLSDVREKSKESCGLVALQRQLLSDIFMEDQDIKISNVYDGKALLSRRLRRKKVFIVIDDADHEEQLKCLVETRDWFGSGSRIIITTRDKHFLLYYGVDDLYEPAILDSNEALHLFCLKAFKNHAPKKGFFEHSVRVVQYSAGLPLALEVLGSFFYGRDDEAQWESAIKRLRKDSPNGILDKLEISYDGLEQETEKNIFLDIACFFRGEKKDFVMQILDGCQYYPEIGIEVLIEKSLLKVDGYNRLRMHDLVQEMGRRIVIRKSIREPGQRCRLWDESDVKNVLTEDTATEAIEGMAINIKGEQNKMFHFSADQAFLKMKRLRLLRVFDLPNCPDIRYLSNKSVLLEWHRFPSRFLPTEFQPNNLVALFLPDSRIEQLWQGDRYFYKLKLVDLKGCKHLIKAPDFTMTPNLESLILEGCTKIKELPPSIGHLSSLVLLNLKDCINLASLPNSIGGCQCLKALNLSGCSRVENLPENLQQVDLQELDLSGTAIREPQSFIFQFKNLTALSFKGCKGAASKFQSYWPSLFKVIERGSPDSTALTLPSMSGLISLTHLNLSDCNLGEGALPNDIHNLPSLKFLILNGNNFISLPENLTQLPSLILLRLSNCKRLKSLPEPLTNIQLVDIDGCNSLEVLPDPSTSNSAEGTSINCSNCYALAEKTNAVTMLKKHLKVLAKERRSVDIFIPGSEIPEWFSHCRYESSIGVLMNLPLPLNIRKDSKWMGVALCCVLGSPSGEDAWGDADIQTFALIEVRARSHREVVPVAFHLESQYHGRCPIIKDHLWLQYWTRDMFYPAYLEGKLDEIEDSASADKQLHDQLWFVFQSYLVGVCPKVKKCGFRLVYEEDLEEIEQMTGTDS